VYLAATPEGSGASSQKARSLEVMELWSETMDQGTDRGVVEALCPDRGPPWSGGHQPLERDPVTAEPGAASLL